jgi:hypothetical protein
VDIKLEVELRAGTPRSGFSPLRLRVVVSTIRTSAAFSTHGSTLSSERFVALDRRNLIAGCQNMTEIGIACVHP